MFHFIWREIAVIKMASVELLNWRSPTFKPKNFLSMAIIFIKKKNYPATPPSIFFKKVFEWKPIY